jgi:hypothetical protein
LFFACRQAGADRSIKEIVRFTGADERKVGKLNSRMKDAETIVPLLKRSRGPAMAATKASQFIDRYCGSLKLDAQFSSHAFDIASRMERSALLEGRNPSTLAAACILIAMFNKQLANPQYVRSETDIAKVAGVSESTVRKAYRDLQPYLNILLETGSRSSSAVKRSSSEASVSSVSPIKKLKSESSGDKTPDQVDSKPESFDNDEGDNDADDGFDQAEDDDAE